MNKEKYGFLGYKRALGRFYIWGASNFNVFFGISLVLCIVAILTAVYRPPMSMQYTVVIVLGGLIPVFLWGGLAVWGKEYKDLLPEYWILKRKQYLKGYPELSQILHEGDLITDEEVIMLRIIRDDYAPLVERRNRALNEWKRAWQEREEIQKEIRTAELELEAKKVLIGISSK